MDSEKRERIDFYNTENNYQFFSRQFLADRGVHARCRLNNQQKNSPATVMLPHMHGFFEIELVIGGCGAERINTEHYPLHRGCMHLIRPGDVHQYLLEDGTVPMYTIQFDETVIPPSLVSEMALISEPLFCDAGEEIATLGALVQMILSLDAPDGEYAVSLLRPHIEILVRYILARVPHREITYSPLVRESLSYISMHYYRRLTLDMLAKRLSVSPEHLGRLFRAELDCGLPEYVNRFRLQIAANLIRSTRYTLRQISAESGYTSYRHFAREFALYYGVPPGKYRELTNT